MVLPSLAIQRPTSCSPGWQPNLSTQTRFRESLTRIYPTHIPRCTHFLLYPLSTWTLLDNLQPRRCLLMLTLVSPPLTPFVLAARLCRDTPYTDPDQGSLTFVITLYRKLGRSDFSNTQRSDAEALYGRAHSYCAPAGSIWAISRLSGLKRRSGSVAPA